MNQGESSNTIFSFDSEQFGYGEVVAAWSPDFNYLAACGESRVVKYIDRQGNNKMEMPLKSTAKVIALHWDKDGDSVAILQRNYTIIVWNPGTKSVTEIDMPSKKDFASFIKWSTTEPVLAIGTEKGSLVFFNKQNQRKIPCVGKHAKKITTGSWNSEGTLITGADDKIFTVSNGTGDTVCDSYIVKGPPLQLEWAKPKKDEVEESKSTVEKEVSAIINKKILILLNIETTHNVEITFSSQYGKIVDYQWFGDGYVAASFTNGVVSIISTHQQEIGNEIHSLTLFNSSVEAIVINEVLGKLAVAAHGVIKIVNMNDWSEVKGEQINLSGDVGRITQLVWTSDGQILTCATSNGGLYGFLMVIPGLCCAYDHHIAMLSTLSKVEIKDCMKNNMTVNKINLEIEPAFISLGKNHCAVGINNYVWYYKWNTESPHSQQVTAPLV